MNSHSGESRIFFYDDCENGQHATSNSRFKENLFCRVYILHYASHFEELMPQPLPVGDIIIRFKIEWWFVSASYK